MQMTRMNRAAVAASLFFGTVTLLTAGGLLLLFANRSTWGPPGLMFTDAFGPAALGLVYGTVGAFLFSRFPRNVVTWVFCLLGGGFAFAVFSNEYTIRGLVTAPGSLPALPLVVWLNGLVFSLTFPFSFALLLLLFPDGKPPGRGWSVLLWIDLACEAVLLIGGSLPEPINRSGFRNVPLHFAWPSSLAPLLALAGSPAWKTFHMLAGSTWVILVLSIPAALAALLWRLWHRQGVERQQLKWLAFPSAGMAIGFAVMGLEPGVSTHGTPTTLSVAGIGLTVAAVSALIGMPSATLIAIMRYRLYDIDLVINKTLVYGSLALFITAVYVLVIVNIGALVGGGRRLWLSLVTTALIAIAFQPLRHRAQRLANRLVYGKRATPYEALSQFNDHLAQTYGGEDLLDRMTRILAEATGAERAELWVKSGSELIRTSCWPRTGTASLPISDGRLPEIEAAKVVEVKHQGVLLGALAINKKRGESLTSHEEKLLSDLAGQAGLVLENAGLNRELLARLDDLRASRQRLVTAQDEERRRIERNLHDGAQQELVALNIKLSLLERTLLKDPEKARVMAGELRSGLGEALETLRELAHGIYPPLLASEGLATALQQQARKSALPVDLEIRHLPRQRVEVEAAVYFCCLEALQNLTKHAQASRAEIRLSSDEGMLHFEVRDDGRGFDAGAKAGAAGLQNMRDRVEALGGALQIRSRLGAGTTVAGSIPLRPVGSAAPAPSR